MSVSDRRFRRVVLLSCLLGALLLAELAAGAGWAAAFAVGAMLFPAAAAALQGLFLESATKAVEARHYPNLGPPNAQGWSETFRQAAFFAGAALGLNLLLLVWLFAPPLGLLLFWLLNGWLCGREHFEGAAVRRLDPEAARALRHRHRYRFRVWLAGVAIA